MLAFHSPELTLSVPRGHGEAMDFFSIFCLKERGKRCTYNTIRLQRTKNDNKQSRHGGFGPQERGQKKGQFLGLGQKFAPRFEENILEGPLPQINPFPTHWGVGPTIFLKQSWCLFFKNEAPICQPRKCLLCQFLVSGM